MTLSWPKLRRPSGPRRLLTIGFAVILGAVGALVVATPASAHYSTLQSSTSCDHANSKVTVTWKVTSNLAGRSQSFKLWAVAASHSSGGSTVTDLATYPTNSWTPVGQTIIVTQVVAGDASSATLRIKSKWQDNYKETSWRSQTITFGGSCTPEASPTVQYQPQCNGSVEVLLNNLDGTGPAAFRINGAGPYPVAAKSSAKQMITPTGHVTVTENGNEIGTGYNYAPPPECSPVKIAPRFDCTSFAISFDNPQGPPTTYSVTVGTKTVTGDLPVSSQPKETEAFSAGAGTSAIVTVGTLVPVTIYWEKPETCISYPTGPALPDTGSSVTGMVGLGAGMLGGGAMMIGLLFLLRRRRSSISGP